MYARSISNVALMCGLSIALLAAPVLATPRIQTWQAASGAKVLFVENHDLPMLDVAVNFDAGSRYDPPEKAGLAGMTHGLLNHGAEGLSEDDIARKLADIGAQMGGGADPDRAFMSLRTLSSEAEREQALEIMARVLQQPLFADDVLAREKTRTIEGLKEAATKPEHIAGKAFSKAVYGEHPYGATVEVETVQVIERSDIVNFYQAHYAASSAVIAIMGDVTRAQAEAIAQRLSAGLPQGVAAPALPQVTTRIAPSEQRIAHPATQSHIFIGAPGMARTDPDYFALYVGNYSLGGGGFVSRLMNEVREKRGLAYSVYSYFMPMQMPGAFQIGLQTKKDQADVALKIARDTLREFIAKGPTEKELKAAKQNIIGGFPLRIDSNKKILDYLSVIGFYGLPLTYLDDFTNNVQKVTTAQIREAFKRHIDPDAMATVIVGAPETEGAGK